MNLFSNIRRAGRYFLPALFALGCVTACSDDDDIALLPLDTPNVTNSASTVSSLTFTWEKVSNVSSYSCVLFDPDGQEVDGLTTTSTSATFTGLEPNTTYTLEVYAYAAIGSANTTSKVATLTATTAAVAALDAPELAVAVNGTTAVITWQAVENAVGYGYSYMTTEGEVANTVSETSLTLRNLSQGEYRISVYAIADEEDEAHSDSPANSITFTIEREKQLLCRKSGTFTRYGYSDYAPTGTSWKTTLMAYDDGSYKLAGWYGVEGYDLEFTVEGTEIVFTNYEPGAEYYYVNTGLDNPAGVYVYTTDGYSGFSGDIENGGSLWWTVYTDNYYMDQFTWSAGLTIDDLVGSYTEETSGYDTYFYNNTYWGTDDKTFYLTPDDPYASEVTIAKVDDSTITLTGLYWASESLTGIVDLTARTITFAAGQTFQGWAAFGKDGDSTASVVANIANNGVITINGWAAWYYGTAYIYGANTILTPQ